MLTQNGVCNTLPYVLTFEDNFDGTVLDTAKWRLPYQGVSASFTFTSDKQWYANTGNTPALPSANNIEVSNGTLKLIAKKETPNIIGTFVTDWSTQPYTTNTSSFNYSSAEIISQQSFHYGYYEMRCKIPKGKGLWPAFWLFDGPVYNEIDIFEFWNEDNILGIFDPNLLAKDPNMDIHHDYDLNGKLYHCSQDNLGTTDYSAAFHVFGLEYTPNRIEWFIDGVSVREFTLFFDLNTGINSDCNSLSAGNLYGLRKSFVKDPMKIRANFAIQTGGINAYHPLGNSPDANTPFPSNYEIDYIRYYKKTNCLGALPITATNISQLSISPANAYTVVATPFNMNTGFTVPNGQVLQTTSRTEVVLGPGFTAIAGCDYKAKIDPTACKEINVDRAYMEGIDYTDVSQLSLNAIVASDQIAAYFESNQLTVKINTPLINQYELYLIDNFGKTIYHNQNVDKNQTSQFEINYITKGLYILRIKDLETGNFYTRKIIHNE